LYGAFEVEACGGDRRAGSNLHPGNNAIESVANLQFAGRADKLECSGRKHRIPQIEGGPVFNLKPKLGAFDRCGQRQDAASGVNDAGSGSRSIDRPETLDHTIIFDGGIQNTALHGDVLIIDDRTGR
jgi:hypothetical protein